MEYKKHRFNIYPEMQPEEFERLRANIFANGYDKRYPIWIFEGEIIDGWNRYRACQALGVEPYTQHFLGSAVDAMQLVIRSNDRRDLNSSQRAIIAVEAEEVVAALKAEAAKRYLENVGRPSKEKESPEKIPEIIPREQREVRTQLAETFGTNPRYISDAFKLKKENPEIAEQVKAGKKTLPEVKKEERIKQLEANRARVREELESVELKPTEKKYRVIYADPPWMYDGGKPLSDKYGDVQKHYPPMETPAICALPVQALASQDCVLFLWATAPKLPEALEVMKAWGFQYKTCIVWDKVKHNFGFYFSVRHELLLIGGRGSSTPDNSTGLHDSVISIERSEKHSEKPEYFRQLIDQMYNGEKIELFARQSASNWDVWGNQV
jgi:N6-adenosine-specific RNA methylase IME4